MSRLIFPLDALMGAIDAGDDITISDLLTTIAETVNTRLQELAEGKGEPMTREETEQFQAALAIARDAAMEKRQEILGQLQNIERKKRAVHAYRNY